MRSTNNEVLFGATCSRLRPVYTPWVAVELRLNLTRADSEGRWRNSPFRGGSGGWHGRGGMTGLVIKSAENDRWQYLYRQTRSGADLLFGELKRSVKMCRFATTVAPPASTPLGAASRCPQPSRANDPARRAPPRTPAPLAAAAARAALSALVPTMVRRTIPFLLCAFLVTNRHGRRHRATYGVDDCP